MQTLAGNLSRQPYRPPPADLPPALGDLNYDAYREVRFDPAHALWKAQGLPFRLQFFHRGGLYRDRVDIYEISGGRPVPIAYSPDQFRFKHGTPPELPSSLGFAGFRIHAPINRRSYFDEVAVFLGASYFRAVAKGMLYGLSARGLALGAGRQEEFPAFRAFWVERPAEDARSLTVLALMDGPSCTAAFRFIVTPGATTIFDTRAHIYPRVAIDNVGIAPLTSMYLFGADTAGRFNDFRTEVHDSDGLAVTNGAGERIWRPLINPSTTQSSAFADRRLRGFGLIQRERRLDAYRDLEARYDLRPSAWVEPVGSWGPGDVRLVELPTRTEYGDNIVAFWAPDAVLPAGTPAMFSYRLYWGSEPPGEGVARVVQTRSVAASSPARRGFAVDFAAPATVPLDSLTATVTAGSGEIFDVKLYAIPQQRGVRLSFELDPGKEHVVELRAVLLQSGQPRSEVWLYRWAA